MNYQKMMLLGRLSRDVELRYSQGGLAIAKFGIASNRRYKDNDKVCFFDVTAFGKIGETIEKYLKKGDPLFIEGHFELNKWEDKQTGQQRQKLELIVESFQFVGGSSSGSDSGTAKSTSQQDIDNIPF